MKTPLHKHIGHHARRIGGHFTKYLYERDTIFATAWVFIFILAVKFLPMPNIHFFDPVEIALEDFDFNDIAYSNLGKGNYANKEQGDTTKFDHRIVLINIGHADREAIAYMIEKTASMKPKVIGLDAFFEGPRDPHKDSLLREAFRKTKNLVVVSRIKWAEHEKKHEEKGEEEEEGDHFQPDYFDPVYSQTGFGNITGETIGTKRHISPYEKIGDSVHYCFAAMLAKNYDADAFNRLVKRHDHNEIINYSRRVDKYQLIEGDELLNGNVDDSALSGKIALLAYVNTNPDDIEDKLFTPMNAKFAGKSIPDMNGIVVHANIISMILDHKYINKLPSWVALLVAILIGWIHMSFFIRYYLENHIWFHLVAKFLQLVSAIGFVYLGMYLFSSFRIKVDMSLTVIVIVLAVDIIYFYEAFAVWMHKKFGYRTVFHKQHH
jgi:CHASE2 domain-containing sensor protein